MSQPPRDSLPPAYFEEIYGTGDDPWSFETSPYEAAKYAATLAALPRPRYQSGFEIGCSIGVLTEQLAGRCDALLAVDVSRRALRRARARCDSLPHVSVQRMQAPREFPDGMFDLIVLSEVGYYWSTADLHLARDMIVERLMPDGHVLLVHWTPYVADYPLTGDEVHEAFLECSGTTLRHLAGRREPQYRLDLFERR